MRTGPEATDPLEAAWVEDQLADAGGWAELPARAQALVLVATASAEGNDNGAMTAEAPVREPVLLGEESDHDAPFPAPGSDMGDALPDGVMSCPDPADQAAPPPGDPFPVGQVAGCDPTERRTDPEGDVTGALARDAEDLGAEVPAPEPGDDGRTHDQPTEAMTAESPLAVEDAPGVVFEAPGSAAAMRHDLTDLSAIPGIGPGLIWMLREAGVATLEDLARADAQDLARKLGSIARLLDLDWFIDLARTRIRAR
jgi:predicted flap endonuclease-1-like 5' DNA nuclease